jgi:hypothetical protein
MFKSRFLSSHVAPIGSSILVCGALLLLLTTTRDDVPKTGADATIPAITDSHLLASAETLPSQPPKPDYTASNTEQPQRDPSGEAVPSVPSPEVNTVSATLGETDLPWAVGTAVQSSEPVKAAQPIESASAESTTPGVEQGFEAEANAKMPKANTEQPAPKQASRPDQRQNTSRPAHWRPMALAPSNRAV